MHPPNLVQIIGGFRMEFVASHLLRTVILSEAKDLCRGVLNDPKSVLTIVWFHRSAVVEVK
jgi:hypothetical protein